MKSGHQDFHFDGAQFSGQPGSVIFAGGYVYADVDGDKVTDSAIHVVTHTPLVAADSVL